MIINVNKQSLRELSSLIYIGNLIINGNRQQADRLQSYDSIAEHIYQLCIESKIVDDDKEGTIDDYNELLMEELERTISNFERKAMPHTLAQMPADKNFPILNGDDSLIDLHYRAESLYENELEKNGVKNLNIKF